MARGIGNRQKKVVTPKKVWVKPAPVRPKRVKGKPARPTYRKD